MAVSLQNTREWFKFCCAAGEEYWRTGLVCIPPSWSLVRRTNPYVFYAKLRQKSPIHRSTLAGGVVVSRAADVQQVLKDDNFTSDASASAQWKPEVMAGQLTTMILEDGAQHKRHRSVLSTIMHSLRPVLGELVRQHVERGVAKLEANQRIDLMEAFVNPMIRELTCDILGVPSSVRLVFRAIMRPGLAFAFNYGDLLIRYPAVMKSDLAEAVQLRSQLGDQFHALIQKEGAGNSERFIPCLRELYQRQEISLAESYMLTEGVLSALYEPLAYSVGNAMQLLSQHQTIFAEMLETADGVAKVTRETLRMESAVQAIFRYARQDSELQGHRIHAGESLVLLLGSANRDPEHFTTPDAFTVDRQEKASFTFGLGHHACLGASLAQMVVECVLRALRQRFDRIELTQKPSWQSTLPMRGFASLPGYFGRPG